MVVTWCIVFFCPMVLTGLTCTPPHNARMFGRSFHRDWYRKVNELGSVVHRWSMSESTGVKWQRLISYIMGINTACCSPGMQQNENGGWVTLTEIVKWFRLSHKRMGLASVERLII